MTENYNYFTCLFNFFSSYWEKLTLWLLFFGFFILVWIWLTDRWRHIYKTSWFLPDNKAKTLDPTWDDVARIAKNDPLTEKYKGKLRGFPSIIRGEDIAYVVISTAVFIFLLGVLLSGAANQMLASLSAEKLTVLGVLFSIAITLYIALRQLKAKVRSENRQKWIDQVRTHLSKVIRRIPSHKEKDFHQTVNMGERDRLALELLMNPEEKDHRVLGYLLRKAYGYPVHEVDIVIEKVTEIEFLCALNRNKRKDHDKMISYIIRLSNAILKREWERVKYGN